MPSRRCARPATAAARSGASPKACASRARSRAAASPSSASRGRRRTCASSEESSSWQPHCSTSARLRRSPAARSLCRTSQGMTSSCASSWSTGGSCTRCTPTLCGSTRMATCASLWSRTAPRRCRRGCAATRRRWRRRLARWSESRPGGVERCRGFRAGGAQGCQAGRRVVGVVQDPVGGGAAGRACGRPRAARAAGCGGGLHAGADGARLLDAGSGDPAPPRLRRAPQILLRRHGPHVGGARAHRAGGEETATRIPGRRREVRSHMNMMVMATPE
mmetsp:Transcript_38515/g.124907  ORF Transcript_38515/g.124907 Transcript_38515/m.124907 type:complete len:276 (-) Transcript_38515:261-1088(-)